MPDFSLAAKFYHALINFAADDRKEYDILYLKTESKKSRNTNTKI